MADELTLEQQQARARAQARLRLKQQENPGFFDRVEQRIDERFSPEELALSTGNRMNFPGTNIDVPDMTSNAIQLVGKQGAGTAWDVLGEGLHSAWDSFIDMGGGQTVDQFKTVAKVAQPAVDAYANSSLGQFVGDLVFKGVDAWDKFKKDDPKQARNVEAITNTALFLNPTTKALPVSRESGSVLRYLDEAIPVKPKPLEVGGPLTKTSQAVREAVGHPSKSVGAVGRAAKQSGVKASVAKKEKFVQKLIEPHNPLADTTRVSRTTQETGPLGRLLTDPSKVEAAAIKETMLTAVKPKHSLHKNAAIIREKIGRLAETLQRGLAREARIGRQERAASKKTTEVGGIRVVEEPMGVPRGHYLPKEVDDFLELSAARVIETPFAAGSERAVQNVYNTFRKVLEKQKGNTLQGLYNARVQFDKVFRAEFKKLQKKQQGAMQNETAINQAVMQLRNDINSFIADRASNTAVKDLLGRQSALYSAHDAIAVKAAVEGKNRITRFLQTATRQMALRDTSLQWVSAGMIAAGAVSAPWFPVAAWSLGIPGFVYLTGKGVMSPAARKGLGRFLIQMDRAIQSTTDPKLIRQLRADRAAILEIIKSAEEE